jgi:hypothetical protein
MRSTAPAGYGWYDRAALLADLTFPVLYLFGDAEPLRRGYARIAEAAQAAGSELVVGRAVYLRAGMLADDHRMEEIDAFADCVARFRRLGAVASWCTAWPACKRSARY